MALLPSRQFYPTANFLESFHCSASKIHGSTRMQLSSYGTLIPSKNQNLNSDSSPEKLLTKSNFSVGNKKKKNWGFITQTPISQFKCSTNLSSSSSISSSSWINKWKDSRNRMSPKCPQAAFSYRDSDSGDSNGNGGSTMERIVEKLKKFGYVDDDADNKTERMSDRHIEKGSIEDIFYVDEGHLPNARGGFSENSPLGMEKVFGNGKEVRFPWEKPVAEEEENRYSVKLKSRTSVAEMTIPHSELRRLKNLAVRMKNKTRIGGGGVTQDVVDLIHEKWKLSEIVRLKIEGAPALNMKRMHEILERKTGGLVIWRSGTSVSLYRGVGYVAPSLRKKKQQSTGKEISHNSVLSPTEGTNKDHLEPPPYNDIHAPRADLGITNEEKKNIDISPDLKYKDEEVKYEDEIDKLLDGLGPRYTDWPGCDPLPVDADLLPGIVPDYQPPFRILPYGVRSTLAPKESTALRRLARVIAPHFALGRSRQHQGLAMSMAKLWQSSSIAKIALKRGVQLTTSERMAEEIKKLTGGVLLSRNKDFLVFYRGKDFLSPDVAEALLEKERLAKTMQDEEEQARLRASTSVFQSVELIDASGIAGTLGESLDANAKWGKTLNDHDKKKVKKEAEVLRHANLVRKLESKLAFADRKLMKAERALAKVEGFLNPKEGQPDLESISDEERFMFRKLGLRMKAFLLLGRRGVFDGTVENMHLHWKYRELVKIMVKAKNFDEVKKVAISLEAESGGVLVSVDKVSKGYAIIVFRGLNYTRPPGLRPKNLLTKRKALARSIELQRREALLNHISTLETRVGKLRSEIDQMGTVEDLGDEELYDKLDSAYLTDDEDTEDEGDEAYLGTYGSDGHGEDDDDDDDSIPNFPYDFQDQDSKSETESEDPRNSYAVAANASLLSRNHELEEDDI